MASEQIWKTKVEQAKANTTSSKAGDLGIVFVMEQQIADSHMEKGVSPLVMVESVVMRESERRGESVRASLMLSQLALKSCRTSKIYIILKKILFNSY